MRFPVRINATVTKLHRAVVALSGLALLGWLLSPVGAESRPTSAAGAAVPEAIRAALLPAAETGADQFLREHPAYDGRETVVAIFDTGVDPGAPHLTTTPQGVAKFVDLIDATGDGDVPLDVVRQAAGDTLTGLTGRVLSLDPRWKNPSGEFRLGMKGAWELFPPELVVRLKHERKQEWDHRQRVRLAELKAQLDKLKSRTAVDYAVDNSVQDESAVDAAEVQARIDVLQTANKDYDDPGPIYDCVAFHDGECWRAVVDTDEDGDLAEETVLTDYDHEPGFATFGDNSSLNFSVHFYDAGKTLSLVTVSGEHGTHVAGIVAAYDPTDPDRNGVAPGARLVSVKIGHNGLDGMETGAALTRGVQAVLKHKCDLINMSYGEPSTVPNQGRLIALFQELTREHPVVFVSSAGNSGPALSTVGAPGGSSSGVLGVGAYVSSEMAQAEYTMRETIPDLPYTWTSRGPTLDGAEGVDIFAPGGAIAPVPNYSLQPARQMNGTSMAAPNACGNIALLLSGLKDREIAWNSVSILRALQRTARPLGSVDPFAQGPGLLQVHSAFEHLTADNAYDAELVDVEVRVQGGGRGIYLREPWESRDAKAIGIELRPNFPQHATNAQKLAYEIPLQLRSPVAWVKVGPLLLLPHDGRPFEVEIDPTQLRPGVHYAEILGIDARYPDRGPLVRIPVTVIRPAADRIGTWTGVSKAAAGEVSRHFIAVPEQAQAATLHVKRSDSGDDQFGYLHLVQLVPGQSFEEGEVKWPIRLSPGEEAEKSFRVAPGRTLELCWGPYWSSLGSAEIEFEFEFHGLVGSEQVIDLPSDGGAVRLDVTNHFRPEKLEPKATFDTRRMIFLPRKQSTKALAGDRDQLPDAHRSHELTLEYGFELKKSENVTLRCPQLEELLYDSPVEGLYFEVVDEHSQLVAVRDMYAESQKLPAGKLTVQLHLRHADPEQLKRWQKLAIAIDRSLGRSVSIPVAATRMEGADRRAVAPRRELAAGEQTSLWLHAPDTPGDVAAGEMLLGELQPVPGLSELAWPVRYIVPGNLNGDEDDEEEEAAALGPGLNPKLTADEALREFQFARLAALEWPRQQDEVTALQEELAKSPEDRQRLAVTMLTLIDSDAHRKEQLDEVVAAADAVIRSIPRRQVQSYFGVRHEPETTEEKRLHTTRTKQRDDLVDALYRKGRALGYMELPDVLREHPIANQQQHDAAFARNFRELSRWVDTHDDKYILLRIRKLRRAGELGAALKLLRETSTDNHNAQLLDRKRRDMYGELGWSDWQEYQQNWMLRRYGPQ
ncbi:MAG: S8 family serine peptidase [Planctomycetaceae bacterium]|nr:S8 family serine peptidase [Planctomycetaceae bacterium]